MPLGIALAVMAASGAMGSAMAAGSVAAGADQPGVRVATTGTGSELVKKIPITTRRGEEKRVVMSMKPATLPGLVQGDRLRLTSEMQVTVNCAFPSARCVGPIYHYDPIVRIRLVLAPDPETTGGPKALPLTGYERDACTQHKPHREHHCVLVFTNGGLVINRPAALPCPLDECHVNMVADAHHPNARPGEVVLVGGNRPDGSIPQDRGRINAIRYRGVAASDFGAISTDERLLTDLPPDFDRRVVYSLRLDDLSADEQLSVSARMLTDIRSVRYAVRTSARLILADSPSATKQGKFVKGIADYNGEIAENNGFNCTQNKGTCLTRKVGVLRMRRDAVDGQGRPVPLYVNLVTVFGPKVLSARPGDRIELLEGGIRVVRFPPELNH